MTDKEINDAFDEILKNIEEQSKKPLEMPEIEEEEEEKVETPVVEEEKAEEEPAIEEESKETFEIPEIKSPSPEVDKLVKPILEEPKQAPIIIDFNTASKTKPVFNPPEVPTNAKEDKEAEVPKFDIPNIVPFKQPVEDIPEEENKSKLPDAAKVLSKSIGDAVIPKVAQAKEMTKELYEKKKKLITKIVAIVIVTSSALGIADYQIKQGYKPEGLKAGQFISYSMESDVPESDVEDIGWEIANMITDEMQQFNALNNDPTKEYDANKAVLQTLGLAYDQIVDTAVYTKKGTLDKSFGAGERNDYWMVKLYGLMQYHLKAKGVIDLPGSFEDYLAANGLNRGKMNYNPITNKLRLEDAEEPVDYYQSLTNLAEYSKYLIGHHPNPAVKIGKKFVEKMNELQNMYPDLNVRINNDGIQIFDEKGVFPVYDVISLDPIVLVETQKNVNEEGVTSARS